jgi:tRNA dimethylallyltransferase
MYLTVLLHGLAAVPDTPSEVREKFQALTNEEMHETLRKIDPITAQRLHVNDRQRVSRALEVWEVTQMLPSTLFSQHRFESAPVVSLLIVLCHPREELYRRINLRAEKMIQAGLLDETASLIKRYGESPLLSTIGYLQAKQCLEGHLPKERLIEEIALHTRRFSKRQMTYLRNEPIKRGWNIYPREGEGRELEQNQALDGARTRRNKATQKSFLVFEYSLDELLERVQKRLQEGLLSTEVWYVHLEVTNKIKGTI